MRYLGALQPRPHMLPRPSGATAPPTPLRKIKCELSIFHLERQISSCGAHVNLEFSSNDHIALAESHRESVRGSVGSAGTRVCGDRVEFRVRSTLRCMASNAKKAR